MTETTPYFVIFGTMRSGSNLLEKTLDCLPDVVTHGEVFNPSFMSKPRYHDYLGWPIERRDADPLGFFRVLLAANPGKITGLRLFNGHSRAMLSHALADPNCRRIILKRDPVESWVSLAIARETDQWILRNPRRRVTAMATFVAEAFEAYRDDWRAHYAWMNDQMARAGTSALRIDYADLRDPATMARAAEYIGSAHTPPEEAPIHRQNPEPMSAKVVNYAEMVAYFGHERPGWTAPPPAPVSQSDLVLCRHAPLAYAPIEEAGQIPALAFMQRLDHARFGAPAEPVGGLAERVANGEVFDKPGADDDLSEILAKRLTFTFVRHPAARVHAAFLHDLFGRGWQQSPIRRAMQERVGALPTSQMIEADKTHDLAQSGFTPDQHIRAFVTYLSLIEGAIDGSGPYRLRPAWRTQTEILAIWRQLVPHLVVAPFHRFGELATSIADKLGVDPVPPGQLYSLQISDQLVRLPLERCLTPEAEGLIRALYAEDYAAFGFDAFNPVMEDPRAERRSA